MAARYNLPRAGQEQRQTMLLLTRLNCGVTMGKQLDSAISSPIAFAYKNYPRYKGGDDWAAALPVQVSNPAKHSPPCRKFEAVIDSGACRKGRTGRNHRRFWCADKVISTHNLFACPRKYIQDSSRIYRSTAACWIAGKSRLLRTLQDHFRPIEQSTGI